MVYNDEKFIKNYAEPAIKQVCPDKPTEGCGCAVATTRFLRDGFCAAFQTKDKKKTSWTGDEVVAAIKEEALELIKQLAKEGAKSGFGSNASAMAKACGYKAVERTVPNLTE